MTDVNMIIRRFRLVKGDHSMNNEKVFKESIENIHNFIGNGGVISIPHNIQLSIIFRNMDDYMLSYLNIDHHILEDGGLSEDRLLQLYTQRSYTSYHSGCKGNDYDQIQSEYESRNIYFTDMLGRAYILLSMKFLLKFSSYKKIYRIILGIPDIIEDIIESYDDIHVGHMRRYINKSLGKIVV